MSCLAPGFLISLQFLQSKLGRTKFAEQSSNYTVDFARAVARYPSEQGGAAPIRNPADNVPRPEPVMVINSLFLV